VALELVRDEFGVCLVPALTAFQVAGSLDGIALYATDHGNRHTVAVLADQYLRLAPYKGLVEALQAAGRKLVLPPILPMPRSSASEIGARRKGKKSGHLDFPSHLAAVAANKPCRRDWFARPLSG
jgi:hypothetical protein